MRKQILLGIFLGFLPWLAWAQGTLQTPEVFLGYKLGTHFTRHHQVVDYFKHVAQANPNVKLISYGQTFERRPLMVAVISTPENMAKLEEIRTNNLRRIGLMDGAVSGLEKPITWMSYNVHGNEASSTEAAMQVIYDLANPQNAKTQAWLAQTVVVIDPCINPDGRDRYVNWYNTVLGAQYNPIRESREHVEPWPQGRSNHYLFDLNRDWAWGVQIETQQRNALYHQWMPQIHADYHEQGIDEPYYFPPAAEPYHKVITPWQRTLQMMIGKNHAKYFDAKGWMYFSREVFDLFYPGYGDTWPMYQGSLGMTYEQAGIGAGLGVNTAEGDVLTLVDRVAHHHTTSLSIIEVAAENASRIMTEYQKFFQQTPAYSYKTYVLRGDEGSLRSLQNHLTQQGIRFGKAGISKTTRGFSYLKNADEAVNVQANDMVVSVFQPRSVLTHVLFEPKTVVPDSLTYDITSWSLPYVYGLEAYALPDRIDPVAWTATTVKNEVSQAIAYLAEWKSFTDAQFLAAVLKAGYKVRFTTKPLKAEGKTYAPGSLILARHMNDKTGGEQWAKPILDLANAHQKKLVPLMSGMAEEGPDLGSANVSSIRTPRIAMIVGSATQSLSAGEVWHFMDQQLKYPVTLLNGEDLGRANLTQYEVLILPSGNYNSVLHESNLNKVREWIRNGGRLIAIEAAVSALVGKEGFAIKTKMPADAKKDAKPEDEMAQRLRKTGDAERESLREALPGAIYKMQVDNTNPLGYGYGTEAFVLKQDPSLYEFMTDGDNVAVIRKNGWQSGFVGSKLKRDLQEVLVYGTSSLGRGKVVYLAENPLFRGFWYHGKLLFSNALFMVGQP